MNIDFHSLALDLVRWYLHAAPLDIASQLMILNCGVTAVFLSQTGDDRLRRWACIFGLASQPAWFYTTWTHNQPGVFVVCFLYMLSWLNGVRTFWLKAAALEALGIGGGHRHHDEHPKASAAPAPKHSAACLGAGGGPSDDDCICGAAGKTKSSGS